MTNFQNICLGLLLALLLLGQVCHAQAPEPKDAEWPPKELLTPQGNHPDWQSVPVPQGWDRRRLDRALREHLKELAATTLPGSKVEQDPDRIRILCKTRMHDTLRRSSKGYNSPLVPRRELGPESDGLILDVWLTEHMGQLERPALLDRPPWKAFCGQLYLPDIKLYLNVNVDYGSQTDIQLLAQLCAPTRWLKAIFEEPALWPHILAQRDFLLAQADTKIRKGLLDLAKKFPHLKNARGWESVAAGQSDTATVRILLFHVHTGKARTVRQPLPESERYSVLVVIQPPPRELTQLDMSPLYPNLYLVGQVGTTAGSSELDPALKGLVADALAPLEKLENSQKKLKSRYERFNLKLAVDLLPTSKTEKYQFGQSIVVEAKLKNTTDATQVYPRGFGMTSMKSSCQVELITPDGKAWAAEAVPLKEFDNYNDIVLQPGQCLTIGTWDIAQLKYNPGHVFRTMPNARRTAFSEFAQPGQYRVRWWDGYIQGRPPLLSLPLKFELITSQKDTD